MSWVAGNRGQDARATRARREAAIGCCILAVVAATAAAQTTQGKLKVNVTANGRAASATMDVLAAGDRAALASGDAGRAVDVPAGAYELRVVLTEAIDRPVLSRSGIVVEAGRETAVDVDFEVGRVTLMCGGAGYEADAKARIRRPGAPGWLPEVRCGEEFLISGGTYETEIVAGAGRDRVVFPVRRIQVMGGATQALRLEAP